MDINEEVLPEDNSGIVLNIYAVSDLKKAAKWAQFLAIIGFIGSGIIALVALSIGSIFARIAALSPMGVGLPAAVSSVIMIVYLLLAAVTFILHLFLYQFATRSINALSTNNSDLLAGGIHRLQSYFKMIGIVVIIELAFMVLGFICLIAFGALMQHAMAQ